jgi:hypothetical protein
MNDTSTPATAKRSLPVTAEDALALWDAGEPVPAIRVESEGASQGEIYTAAFECIRASIGNKGTSKAAELLARLTQREREAANSIHLVALKTGWAAMLRQHTHDAIAKIQVQNPKS